MKGTVKNGLSRDSYDSDVKRPSCGWAILPLELRD